MWVLAATLTCVTATVMTSCSDDDVENVMENLNIVGKWNTKAQLSPTAEGVRIEYGNVVEFKADGSFIGIDEKGEQNVGTWKLRDKTLRVTFTIDGRTLEQSYAIQEGWSRDRMVMTYSFTDEGVTYTVIITMNRVK